MIENAAENRFCIIGAGPSGLTAAKNLKQAGIPFDCFERQDDMGGLQQYLQINPLDFFQAADAVHRLSDAEDLSGLSQP